MEWHMIHFLLSVYLTCILNKNIVHGVICDTVSEHQYIWHVYWTRILYMEWHVKQFHNISISDMYIEQEYCTWSDMWYSFRKSVYLMCVLNKNIVHGVTCATVSEHQYIWHVQLNKTLKLSVFSFCRQLLQRMVLSVPVILQCHQYQLSFCHLNVKTRMGQDVSICQRWDFVYRVVGEGKWDHFRQTSLMLWWLRAETVRKESHLWNKSFFLQLIVVWTQHLPLLAVT